MIHYNVGFILVACLILAMELFSYPMTGWWSWTWFFFYVQYYITVYGLIWIVRWKTK